MKPFLMQQALIKIYGEYMWVSYVESIFLLLKYKVGNIIWVHLCIHLFAKDGEKTLG